jgi:hypothetical protein
MTARHWLSLLLIPIYLAGFAPSVKAGNPSSSPEDAVLSKDESNGMYFYKNNYFTFGLKIPSNWHVMLKKEMVWFMHDPNLRRAIKSGLCFPLLGISKYPAGKPGPKGENNSNFVLYADNLSMYPAYRIETAKDYVEALKKSGMKFASKPSVMKLGEVDLWSFDSFTSQTPESFYGGVVTVRNGFVLRFLLTAKSKTDIAELRDIVKSFHFD